MKEFFKNLISGTNSVSSMRFCMILTATTACLIATYSVVFNKDLQGTALVVGALLINTVAKAIQTFGEK
jgi:hypothetical protein